MATTLLRAIEHAFSGIQLGDGVSLHETVVIDDYGGQEERQAARAPDETHDWRKLVGDPELARISGLSFYDAAGLYFHLPAYLSLAVTDFEREEADNVLDSLMFHLTHFSEYNLARFSILDTPQRQCVRKVLVFLRDEYELESAELDEAIEGIGVPTPRRQGTPPREPTCDLNDDIQIAHSGRGRNMDPEALLQVTRTWSNHDRLAFALRLWEDLVESGWQPEPDDELTAELDRRQDAHEANPTDVRTSEQVWEKLRGKR